MKTNIKNYFLFFILIITNINSGFKAKMKEFYKKNKKIVNSVFALGALGGSAWYFMKNKKNKLDEKNLNFNYSYKFDYDDNLYVDFKFKDIANINENEILNILKKIFNNLNIKKKDNNDYINHLGLIDIISNQRELLLSFRFSFIYLEKSFIENAKLNINNIKNLNDYENQYLEDAKNKKKKYYPTIGFDYFTKLSNSNILRSIANYFPLEITKFQINNK